MTPAKRIEEAVRASFGGRYNSDIQDAVRAALTRERERCAEAADAERAKSDALAQQYVRSQWLFAEHATAANACKRIAAAIRALPEETP